MATDLDSRERADFAWQWNLLENLSSSWEKKQAMFETQNFLSNQNNYVLRNSSKKKKQNLALEQFFEGDSRCSSGIGTHNLKIDWAVLLNDQNDSKKTIKKKYCNIEGEQSANSSFHQNAL